MNNLTKTQSYSYRASWLTLLRPMTLTGTISPAIAGSAFAAQTGTVDIIVFIVFMASALLVQMAVNIFNDYFDFLHGQDIGKWEATDASGFSKKPVFSQLPAVAAALLLIAAVLGIWLAVHSSYWILVVGAISIVAGIYYSAGKPSLASIGAGELVAAVFLGFVVTSLAFVVEGGSFNWEIIAVAFPYAALIASMILVNNIRDIGKDKGFRCTLAITFGRRKALVLLGFLIIAPYFWLFALIASGITGWTTAIAFLALPIAFWLRWKLREGAPRKDERGAMKWSACHHWIFGLLFAFGIAIG